MIKITIERHTTESYKETVQFCLTEKPTEVIAEADYSSRKEVKFERTYEPREVTKWKSSTVSLLEQEIVNEEDFDLKAVIKAVNGL